MLQHDAGDRQAHAWGVGMPALLHLHEFGRVVGLAFGRFPLLVGSALREKVTPRDIDVRLVLGHEDYARLVGPFTECGQPGTRWAALSMAFAALGREMTGLPIDFQVQPPGVAARYRDEQRLGLGYGLGRFTAAAGGGRDEAGGSQPPAGDM